MPDDDAQVSPERIPAAVVEAVNASDRGRSARIDGAVERLVALTCLLPLRSAVAANDTRHELLGRELAEVLLIVLGPVHPARRRQLAGLRRFLADPSVELALRN